MSPESQNTPSILVIDNSGDIHIKALSRSESGDNVQDAHGRVKAIRRLQGLQS